MGLPHAAQVRRGDRVHFAVDGRLSDVGHGSSGESQRDSVFLFRQKNEGIAAFTTDPALQRTLSGLTTVSETYSEVWARVGDAPSVVGRLILDPFSMTAFSTRAEVFDAVRREKSKGKNAVQAIAAVAYGDADKEAAR